jgi:hypothetical protein
MDLPAISKAIAGGLVTALAAELARYGFHPSAETITATGVIVTALVSYAVGHIAVYFAPKNKERI